MRTITIEEHFWTTAICEAVDRQNAAQSQNNVPARALSPVGELSSKLADLGERRLKDMDAAGIDLQVISHTSPGTQTLPVSEAIPLARDANDQLAAAVRAHPDRFAGFATLPTPDPEAAARELERAVQKLGFKGAMINGHTGGRFLDDSAFRPIFEAAVSLDVPLYIHPTEPPRAVREAYYTGFDPFVSAGLATSGWGWHSETAIHALRLVLAGVFDRYPTLQIIIGHMGELIPFYMGRIDDVLSLRAKNLQRRAPDYFLQNFHITTSAIFTNPPLQLALQVMGAERIIFSVDYPYSENERGRAFLDHAPLEPGVKELISHLNAERLLKLL
jgi:uncharacterized protein